MKYLFKIPFGKEASAILPELAHVSKLTLPCIYIKKYTQTFRMKSEQTVLSEKDL